MKLLQGDCLELMNDIPDGSIDMIFCDLPYGTTQCAWDIIIPLEPLWKHYKRVIKKNGAIVLTATQPFSSILVMSNMEMFRYDYTYHKSRVTNVLNAKIQPLRNKEDVLVFYREQPTYNPQGLIRVNKMTSTGSSRANQEGNATGKITQTETGKYFQEFSNYPRQVLEFQSPGKTVHPTQKPVALMEYMIKTYTNPGDLVLDNCMGSGSTGVACVQTDRDFIGIELNEKYFLIAQERISNARTDT